MRRQNFYLLVISLFLLLLPMLNGSGVSVGFLEYISDISNLFGVLVDPEYLMAPAAIKIRASLYIIQLVGWLLFASVLFLTAIVGLIRNKSSLMTVALLSSLVLIHGVVEVAIFTGWTNVPLQIAILTRFGLDFSDFLDDYDALLNSTLVPIGLIVWYFLTIRKSKRPSTSDKVDNRFTENSSL